MQTVRNNNEHLKANFAETTSYFANIDTTVKAYSYGTTEYVDLRTRGVSHPEALKATLESAASLPENGLSNGERSLLRTVGLLGEYIQAQNEVQAISDHAKGRKFTSHESSAVAALKEYIIPFNHELKEYINTHPNDNIRTVSASLANAYSKLYSRHECIDAVYGIDTNIPGTKVFDSLSTTLNGMRHELAAETMLEAAGCEYRYATTAQEENSGNDLFVRIGQREFGVDIKASTAMVEKSQQLHDFSKAVYTGLTRLDFTGRKGDSTDALSIPYAVAVDKAPAFIVAIEDMVHTNAAKKAARRAIDSV